MGDKPKRNWYSILMIFMCIELVLKAAISFRAAGKAIYTMLSQFKAVKDQSIPSHKTICRWLTKLGLYKLNCPKEQADDWALVIDNSIQAGTTKCMMILGVRLSKFRKKPLTFEDMEVLGIEFHSTTSSEVVCKALEKAQKRVGKVIEVCADDGPDLRGGINCFCEKYGATRIYDIIHKIGVFLREFLETNEEWKLFATAAAEAKKKMQQTPAAHLAPPNQRTKSRYLNIDILARWSLDVMVALESKNHPDKAILEKYCGWIRQHIKLIKQLNQFDVINRRVRQHIREKGISSTTGQEIEEMLEAELTLQEFNTDACQYAGKLIDFCHQQSALVPQGKVLIGSSEIIESLFGKLKSFEQDQSKEGFSSLVLVTAACVGKIDMAVVREAMTQVTTADVKAWTNEWIGTTLLSKRRRSLGAWRRKKKNRKVVPELTGVSLETAEGF
jgi:hypothetical protein